MHKNRSYSTHNHKVQSRNVTTINEVMLLYIRLIMQTYQGKSLSTKNHTQQH